MRELAVRLRFTTPSLGNIPTSWGRHSGRETRYYAFPRGDDGRVVLQPHWWRATFRKARGDDVPRGLRVACEVDGIPWGPPGGLFRAPRPGGRHTLHENFATGDVICVTFLAAPEVDDDMVMSLLTDVGRYVGISPALQDQYGRYSVESISTRTERTVGRA